MLLAILSALRSAATGINSFLLWLPSADRGQRRCGSPRLRAAFAIKVRCSVPHVAARCARRGRRRRWRFAGCAKMGTYECVRFAFRCFRRPPCFSVPVLATLAVVGIIYGALVAMVKPMKKLVAYSSVQPSRVRRPRHGNESRVQGAVYQMLSHGISTGGPFSSSACCGPAAHASDPGYGQKSPRWPCSDLTLSRRPAERFVGES